MIAVVNDDTGTVVALKKLGANVNARDNVGETALMYNSEYYSEMAKKLQDLGADVNAIDNDGQTVLMHAARNIYAERGDYELIEKMVAQGVDINARDNEGRTALMYAIANGFSKTAEKLLNKELGINANVNHVRDNSSQISSLKRDASKEQIESFVQCYRGINKDNFDNLLKDGPSLGLDLKSWQDKNGTTALNFLVSQGDKKSVETLIATGNCDINFQNKKGDTALHVAVKEGNTEMVSLLMRNKADPGLPNKDGQTPKDLAKNLDPAKKNIIASMLNPKTIDNLEALKVEQMKKPGWFDKLLNKNMKETHQQKAEKSKNNQDSTPTMA